MHNDENSFSVSLSLFLFFTLSMSHTIKHQTVNIFQIKHIRGILFDDTEKTAGTKAKAQSKNQSIHLEIKPAKFTKPTSTITSNKKAKLTQDDSALTYKPTSKESTVNNNLIQQRFTVVTRPTTTSNE